MKNSVLKNLGISILATTAMVSTAQSREFVDIYTECGLGAMIFPTNNAAAAITNVTWDSGTTAILSDASSEESCKGSSVAAASFIHESYASLENDLAKGSGQHLAALMNLLSCDTSAQDSIKSGLRADFSELVGTEGYATGSQFQKSEAIYNMVNSSAVSGSCGV